MGRENQQRGGVSLQQEKEEESNGEEARFHLEKVLRHERQHDVDAVEDHVGGRHRPTRGRRTLVLVPEHLVCKQRPCETHVKSDVAFP